MSEQLVLRERHGRVLLLTMNRPEKRNAFDNAMYRAMAGALNEGRADASVHVLVITGAGSAFCAGQDFSEMSAESGSDHGFPGFMAAVTECEKPIVTAVNGVGVGLGLTMLLHTDINYISTDARLRAPFVTLGVVPEAASSLLLPLVVGYQKAAEILFTARWIDADESVALGLTLAAVPPEKLLATALAKAAEIAALPSSAIRHTKHLLKVWRRDAIRDARSREDEAFQERLGTPENLEAISAFFAKR